MNPKYNERIQQSAQRKPNCGRCGNVHTPSCLTFLLSFHYKPCFYREESQPIKTAAIITVTKQIVSFSVILIISPLFCLILDSVKYKVHLKQTIHSHLVH
jgi:hypothetical protein